MRENANENNCEYRHILHSVLQSFYTIGLFPYPLKTTENQASSMQTQGGKKENQWQ